MSRTADYAEHDFFHAKDPTLTAANFLKRFWERNRANDRGCWVEVFCVRKGVVDWPAYSTPKKYLKRNYGVESLPNLGRSDGFLIRAFSQDRDPSDEESKLAAQASTGNYRLLAEHIESTYWPHLLLKKA